MIIKSLKEKLDITNAKQLAAGGEGRVLEHPKDSSKVIKVYHDPRPVKFKNHLFSLCSLGSRFVIPRDIYLDSKGLVAGFMMDYVNFNDYYLLNNLFNKGFCNTHNITKDFKIKVLNEIKEGVMELHKNDIVVGDLNQYNIFFSSKGDVLFVDVDSYSTADNPPSGVLLDDIRDWTTTAIDQKTDMWAFDILSFWILSYCHPFKWVVPGNTESLEQRVRSNKSYLSSLVGRKTPPLYEEPSGNIKDQFLEVFKGRRFLMDFDGVQNLHTQRVINIPIASMSLSIIKIESDILKVYCANRKFSYLSRNDKWTLVDASMKGQYRKLHEYPMVDDLYPSNDLPAFRIGSSLTSGTGRRVYDFDKPEYHYSDGFLTVLDYSNDIQWNFDINAQLMGDINVGKTSVYAKSVKHLSSMVQNFGNKKFVNAPKNDKYQLLEVPNSTKDAFNFRNYSCIEFRNKSKIQFRIQNEKGIGFDLDHMAHFTIMNGMILVPQDGSIEVYKDHQRVAVLDCNVCSPDSQLFSTDAGILLLDQGVLYLLNTK